MYKINNLELELFSLGLLTVQNQTFFVKLMAETQERWVGNSSELPCPYKLEIDDAGTLSMFLLHLTVQDTISHSQ